jgi:hypothetical protein
MAYTIADSGRREEFSTGSRRDTREGKGRYDLLPPRAMRCLARHFEEGSKKYGDRNWELGQPMSRLMDSGLRHSFAAIQGQQDEDHLVAAAWNLLAAIEIRERVLAQILPSALADLPGIAQPAIDAVAFAPHVCPANGPVHHGDGQDA